MCKSSVCGERIPMIHAPPSLLYHIVDMNLGSSSHLYSVNKTLMKLGQVRVRTTRTVDTWNLGPSALVFLTIQEFSLLSLHLGQLPHDVLAHALDRFQAYLLAMQTLLMLTLQIPPVSLSGMLRSSLLLRLTGTEPCWMISSGTSLMLPT